MTGIEGSAARAHFQVWWALRNLAIPQYLATMDDHADFFIASSVANYKSFFLALSKIFDRDIRVSGVSNLKEALRTEGHSKLAADFEKRIEPLSSLVERVMSLVDNNQFWRGFCKQIWNNKILQKQATTFAVDRRKGVSDYG